MSQITCCRSYKETLNESINHKKVEFVSDGLFLVDLKRGWSFQSRQVLVDRLPPRSRRMTNDAACQTPTCVSGRLRHQVVRHLVHLQITRFHSLRLYRIARKKCRVLNMTYHHCSTEQTPASSSTEKLGQTISKERSYSAGVQHLQVAKVSRVSKIYKKRNF